MAVNEILGLTLELSADTDKFVKELNKAAGGIDINIDSKKLVKQFGDASKSIKTNFAETIASAAEAGFNSANLSKFTKKLQPMFDNIESSMKRTFELEVKIKAAAAKGLNSDALKNELKLEKERLRGLNARFKKEATHTDRLIKRRKVAMEEAARLAERTAGEAAEEFGKSIKSAFEELKTGDVSGLLKGVGKRAGARGAQMQAAGAAKGGMSGKAMEKLGGLMSKLGPAIGMIGAIAAGFAAIIGIIVGVDAKAKELNRSIFEGGIAAGEMADGFGQVGDSVNDLRKTFTLAIDFNRKWGTTAKDHLEILGGYAKAGITLRELKNGMMDAASAADALRDATAGALTYAKLLGTTNVEMAENMGRYMEDLGLTIKGVQESLSGVHIAAKESGFGIKRFFNMVLQATSGMSMYNVRVEEAAGLLIRLGDILGSKMGGDFLQQLTKGFTDETMQDRYKRVMLTGKGKTKATFGRSAENTAEKFIAKLKGADLGEAFGKAASKAGLTVDFGDAKALVRDLGKLTGKQQTELLAKARMSGDDAMVRQLTNLIGVSQGARGGTGRMAAASGSLDMGGKMMMMLEHGSKILGARMHEKKYDAKAMMKFEGVTGATGEQREMLLRISEAMWGNYDELQALRNDEARYAGMDEFQRKAAQEDQVRAFGAYADESGAIFSATIGENGEIVKTSQKELGEEFGDYVQTQGDVFAKAAKEGVPVDTQLAQDMVRNTTEMTKILEQGVEYWLEKIYGVTEGIWNWFGSGGDKEKKQKELDRLAKEMKSTREKIREKESLISEKGAGMKTETPEGRAKIQAEIDAIDVDIKNLNVGMKKAASDRERVSREGTKFLEQRQVGKPGEGLAEIPPAMKKKVAEEGKKMAKEAWLKHKFGTASFEEYQKKAGTGAGATGAWRAAEHFAGTQGAKGAVARAGGRQYAVPEAMARGKNIDIPLWQQDIGQSIDIARGIGTGEGETFQQDLGGGATSTSFFREGSTGFKDFQKVIGDLDYDPIVQAAQQAEAKREKEEKDRWDGKGQPGPKGIAEAMGPQFDMALIKQDKSKAAMDLMNVMQEAGVTMTKTKALRHIDKMSEGKMPPAVAKLLGRVVKKGLIDPATGQPVAGEAGQDVTVQQRFREKGLFGGKKRAAKDFLMQIGEGGQIKFAQRIDRGDQVTALASKAGGAVQSAGRGGGGQVNIHMYHDAKGNHALLNKMMVPKGRA